MIQETNNTDEATKTASQVNLPRDEIEEFMDGLYVSTSEATSRVLQFPLHAMEPHVIRLPVHHPHGQRVCFSEVTDLFELVDSGCPTELTAWFEFNAKHRAGRHLLYADYVELFLLLPQLHCWMPRQRGHGKTIGRINFIPPSAGEKYLLRVHLTHLAWMRSFEDVRMHNGITYKTFQEPCCQRGLLDDDQEPDNCLTEATTYRSSATLRQSFITILEFKQPEDPWGLWTRHKNNLLDDIVHQLRGYHTINTMPPAEKNKNMALLRVEELLQAQGKSLGIFRACICRPRPTSTAQPNCGRRNWTTTANSYEWK